MSKTNTTLCTDNSLAPFSITTPPSSPTKLRPVLSPGLASVSQSSRGRKGTESHVDSDRLGDPGSPAKLMLMWPRHVAVGSSIRNLMLPAAATYPLCSLSLPPFPFPLSSVFLPLSFSEQKREKELDGMASCMRYIHIHQLHAKRNLTFIKLEQNMEIIYNQPL